MLLESVTLTNCFPFFAPARSPPPVWQYRSISSLTNPSEVAGSGNQGYALSTVI